jgi:3-methyladenine DNA glycosylase AlkD
LPGNIAVQKIHGNDACRLYWWNGTQGEKKLHPEIMKLVKPLENDEEYYVKKAVIWIKKNFAKGK